MLHAKFGANRSNCLGGVRKSTFFICCDFAMGNQTQKWAWPTSHNLATFRVHVDKRIKNARNLMWELFAKISFLLKIVPPAGHFSCLDHRGQSIPPL